MRRKRCGDAAAPQLSRGGDAAEAQSTGDTRRGAVRDEVSPPGSRAAPLGAGDTRGEPARPLARTLDDVDS
ncbi:hypothetical protein RR48_15494 [Papilio machaon]|uniref:Uncharacterized protein n=1 Tax=Papilio machaon TaxID=76193 RepID=A0A194QUZ6_PAPMA|nr:hypothetical protein RR48_15494 [Papilio machaon]